MTNEQGNSSNSATIILQHVSQYEDKLNFGMYPKCKSKMKIPN